MSQLSAFWLMAGPVFAATVFGLVGDSVAGSTCRRTATGVGLLLVVAGTAGIVGGSQVAPDTVHGVLMAGGAYSVVGGLASGLAGLAVLGVAAGSFPRPAQLAVLIAFATCGALVVSATQDLLLMLFGLEILAVAGYAAVAAGDSRRSHEAATKYFVQGSVATALFLVGLALLAVLEGGLPSVGSLSAVLTAFGGPGAIALLLLVVAALSIKAGAAPFHWWAPDAYEAAPSAAAAVLAGPAKLVIVTACAGLAIGGLPIERAGSLSAAPAASVVAIVMATLSVASILIGSLGALAQRDVARMLGYAGVAQVGYAFMAVAALQPTAAVIHIATYAGAATCAFITIGSIRDVSPDWDGSVDGLAALGRTRPAHAASLSVALLSMAGLPPLVGFWGKFLVFVSAVRVAQASASAADSAWTWVFAATVAVAAVGAVVSIGYYGRVIAALYFTRADVAAFDRRNSGSRPDSPPFGSALVVVCASLLLGLGLWPLFGGLPALLDAFTFMR